MKADDADFETEEAVRIMNKKRSSVALDTQEAG